MLPTIDTNRPVPAAIDGRCWTVSPTISDLAGSTDTKRRALAVPVSSTPTARMIRNHELAHARITPAVAAGALCKRHSVSMEALQWSEDARISRLLAERELVDPSALTPEECEAVARIVGGSERGMAGALLVNWQLEDQRYRIMEALQRVGVDPALVSAVSQRVDRIWRDALSDARGKGRRRYPGSKIFGTRSGFRRFTVPLAQRFDVEFPAGGRGKPGDDRGEGKPDPRIERELARIVGRGSWGRVTDIHRPPLTRPLPVRRSPGRRHTDTGVVPRAMHRLPVDGSVFASKRRVPGGTVLCDASGSMRYTDEDIERILQQAPGSTVAFYAGAQSYSDPRGRIVIGASRGKAAAVADVLQSMPGRENMIDAPALRWLARQPAPRFWVSDERVGGVDDFGVGGPCWAECMAICKAANIRVVRRISDLQR